MQKRIENPKSKIFFLVVCAGFFLIGTPVYANTASSCEEDKIIASDISLSEMVKGASFIGMYHASRSKLTDIKLDNNAGLLAQTEFTFLGITLKGEPPNILSLLGAPSSNVIPPYYYATVQRHATVDEKRPSLSGRAPLVSFSDGAECIFALTFVEGFDYLIFGDIDTPMSYEVIFDAEYNDWYQMVVEEIDTSNSD